jgi:hypothetical protein
MGVCGSRQEPTPFRLDCSEEARDANAEANRKGWALELDDLRQHAQNVTA